MPPGQDQVGAIWMKSGLEKDGRIQGHKIRDFVWAYQLKGQTSWQKIPETRLYANRGQLIFRFEPIRGIARMRLLIRPRSKNETTITGANNPCLREAHFYADRNAAIHVDPWWYSVATWEEGNPFDPMQHWGERFDLLPTIQQGLNELGLAYSADSIEEVWIGDFGDWLLHEPAPAGFLLSGNYKDYDTVDSSVYRAFYDFMRSRELGPQAVPMLGACGGHQLIAMAGVHDTLASFNTEFAPYPDSLGQVVVTCSTVPAYACGSLSPEQCCYEGGAVNPFKDLVPNVPGLAMNNPYASPRWDMLFNLLPEDGEAAMRSYLFHEDFVDPAKIAPRFDIIATYPAAVSAPSRANPSLVQAMKLKTGPVYGTQFHWDEGHPERCDRDDGNRNMERVLKNFLAISLDRLLDSTTYRLSSDEHPAGLGALTDLDRSTQWCGKQFMVELKAPQTLRALYWVEGEDASRASHQSYSLEASADGKSWQKLSFERQSAYELEKKNRLNGCDPVKDPVAGKEDGQTYLLTLSEKVPTRFLRVSLATDDGQPACLREVMLY